MLLPICRKMPPLKCPIKKTKKGQWKRWHELIVYNVGVEHGESQKQPRQTDGEVESVLK